MCGGSNSTIFSNDSLTKRHLMETIVFSSNEGLPPAVLIYGYPGQGEEEIFGLLDGESKQYYKFGFEEGDNTTRLLDLLSLIAPKIIPKALHIQPCHYAMAPNSEFIFKGEENGVAYAYGLSGKGFKHFPLHGLRVCDLLAKL